MADNKQERVAVQIGDNKYILPAGAGVEDAKVFERELRDAIRDGDEFKIPSEIETIYNVGRPKTNDKERIMVMEAEMKEMRSKIEALNTKLAEPKPTPAEPATEPAKTDVPAEPPKQ